MKLKQAEEAREIKITEELFIRRVDHFNHTTLTTTEKIHLIESYFGKIMQVIGLDLTDDSLKGTPSRVAKMYINELFSGLDPRNEPTISLFENKYNYKQILIEKNIPFCSTCEHHFLPINGKAHIAYIPNENVIGLSKLNRIVHYFSKRPQVQERLTIQIALYLKKVLNTEDVAVLIKAEHSCVAVRGVEDADTTTITSSFHGAFLNDSKAKEFFNLLNT